ncbi:MAG TPA: methyltransferase domain-containing protein [Burkholderiaceae bacterium]
MPYFDHAELARLDAVIKDIEENSSHDNAELVKRLAEFSIRITGDIADILATDPLSSAYIEKIKRVHEEIIGKQHSRDFEGLPRLNLDYEANWPYPWGTQCPETVGCFLIAYGFLIRSAGLPRGARVLEVGCGMGSLTWNLARMGYRVDAIDPNPAQCEGVRNFTRGFPTPPTVIAKTLDEWLAEREANRAEDKYDAVIFFESFHHLMDHQACLRTLLERHMQPDGKILLGAEPIMPDTSDILPYPWGPRFDGESLRAMRNWGWLELGYTEAYLRSLFDKLGLGFQWFKSAVAAPHSSVVVGSRASFGKDLPPEAEDRYSGKLADGIDFTREGLPDFVAHVSGLSQWESWGRWTEGDCLHIEFSQALPPSFTLQLQLHEVFGPNLDRMLRVKVGAQEQQSRLKDPHRSPLHRFRFDGSNASSIDIFVPQPTRPRDLPDLNNTDTRKLGIGLRSLAIEEGEADKGGGLLSRLFG